MEKKLDGWEEESNVWPLDRKDGQRSGWADSSQLYCEL